MPQVHSAGQIFERQTKPLSLVLGVPDRHNISNHEHKTLNNINKGTSTMFYWKTPGSGCHVDIFC